MKKIFTVIVVIAMIACMSVVFAGCGAKDENVTTEPTTELTVRDTTKTNDGMVTDESEKGDNGVVGDVVTDVSDDVSEMVTDMSDDVKDNK